MVLKQRQTQTDTTAVVDGRTHDWRGEYVSTYVFPDAVCSEGHAALTPTGEQHSPAPRSEFLNTTQLHEEPDLLVRRLISGTRQRKNKMDLETHCYARM